MSSFNPVELIVKKREGGALSPVEIQALVRGFTDGIVADYQMSAFAMAVFLRGMTPDEIAALTLAMRDSGEVLDLSSIGARKVDKHSTGGVGDKVSICLAPLVAACGVAVPMVSGRGLGHSGGTLDKLEAIPGFSVNLDRHAFAAQVESLGCALIGQTAEIAPADKKLYALRDVTGTVESIPLITASILSKKLAEGIDALVLDVKVGTGAFMKTIDQARALAESLVRVGTLAGKEVSAFLTTMNAPLGNTIGNALETFEALEVLHGRGPEDLLELTLVLGAEMLRLGRVAQSEDEGRELLVRAIEDGSGREKMREIVRSQGGDAGVVDDPTLLPRAPSVTLIRSPRAGYVTAIDSLELGWSAVAIGAGRTRVDQSVDPRVGIVIRAHVGASVREGDPLAELHLASADHAERVAARVQSAWTLGEVPPVQAPIVLDVIRA